MIIEDIESLYKKLEKDEKETIYPRKTPIGFFDFFVDYECLEHQNKIEYFDEKTNQFLCNQECLMDKKKGMVRKIDPEAFLKNFYENMERIETDVIKDIEKVQNKQKQIMNIKMKFEENKINAKKQIIEYFDEIVRLVDQQKIKYLNYVEDVNRDKCTKLLRQYHLYQYVIDLFHTTVQDKLKLKQSQVLSTFRFSEIYHRMEFIHQKFQYLLDIPPCQEKDIKVVFLDQEKKKLIKNLSNLCQFHIPLQEPLQKYFNNNALIGTNGWMKGFGPSIDLSVLWMERKALKSPQTSLSNNNNNRNNNNNNNNNNNQEVMEKKKLNGDIKHEKSKKDFCLSDLSIGITLDSKERLMLKKRVDEEFIEKAKKYPKMRSELSCQLAEKYLQLHYYQEAYNKYSKVSTQFKYPPSYVGVYLFFHDRHLKEVFPQNLETAKEYMSLILKNIEYYESQITKYKTQNKKINPLCAWVLAFITCNGLASTKIDTQKAFEYWQISAELGYLPAWNDLGSCYLYGDGPKKDSARAFQLFQYTADRGNINGQVYLADSYLKGIGVEKDLEKAIYWFEIASQYSKSALLTLGDIYFDKLKDNKEKGIEYYKKLNKTNFIESKIKLKVADKILNNSSFPIHPHQQSQIDSLFSDFQQNKKSISFQDFNMCLHPHDICLNVSSDCKWQDPNTIFLRFNKEDFSLEEKEKKISSMLSESHSKESYFILTLIYLQGFGVEKNPSQALQYLEKAIRLGNQHAFHLLASCYHKAIGVEKNFSITHCILSRLATPESYNLLGDISIEEGLDDWGLYYHLKASEKDQPDSNFFLATVLEKGLYGLKKDDDKATEYLRIASEYNHPGALFKLGQIHHMTMPYRAIEYYKKAIKYGCVEAEKALQSLQDTKKK